MIISSAHRTRKRLTPVFSKSLRASMLVLLSAIVVLAIALSQGNQQAKEDPRNEPLISASPLDLSGPKESAPSQEPDRKIADTAAQQIEALIVEKESRTPAQQKIDSQLIYAMKMHRGESIAQGIQTLAVNVGVDESGLVTVDITAMVDDQLLRSLKYIGMDYYNVFPAYHTLRARVSLDQLETIAAWPQIRFIQPKQEAMFSAHRDYSTASRSDRNTVLDLREQSLQRYLLTDSSERATKVRTELSTALSALEDKRDVQPSLGSRTSEGDTTHKASNARSTFGANGAGVRIGVLSDGVSNLSASQALGDLGAVTVLPGQRGSGDEGTAMLEIIHDLAPGAQLYFATAINGIAGFAQNIRDLRTAGCDIIIDDVGYFVETAFQNGQSPGVISMTNGGVVIQAVNDVTASGALYFSAAANSGNKNDGTSGTWEGDFVDGGTLALFSGGKVHDFDPTAAVSQFDTMTLGSSYPINLFWSDPLGASVNDYDLFVLDSTGTSVLASSTNIQSGTQDPFEQVSSVNNANNRIVILQKTGAANRFLHLDTNRGRLQFNTEGNTHGHNAISTNTGFYSVAATPALSPGPYPNPFNSSNTVETFSSDGPRRIFFNADSSAITVGNFSSAGGQLLQKPDITAADRVSVTGVGGFPTTFSGTSASAPHAGAIAALLKSAKPSLTAAQVRTALTSTAIDIETAGVDRDAGAGIIMALEAMQSLGTSASANFEAGTVTVTETSGNGNGIVEPGETASMSVPLTNSGVVAATAINATLSTLTPNVNIVNGTSAYPNLAVSATGTNTTPFTFSLSSSAPCDLQIDFTLTISYSGGESPKQTTFSVQIASRGSITTTLDATPPATAPGYPVTSTGIQLGRLSRFSPTSACGSLKANPGLFDSFSRRFDSYTFLNPSANSACVTVTLTNNCAAADPQGLQSVAYLNSFDPNNVTVNYRGDLGPSIPSTASGSYSFDVPGNATFVVVIDEVNPGSAGSGCNYTIQVSGFCPGGVPPTPTPTPTPTPDPTCTVINGGFESNSFNGWTRFNQVGGSGSWYVYSGTTSPLTGFTDLSAPPVGTRAAVTDESGPGTHILYQDFAVPAGPSWLSFYLYYKNRASAFYTPATLSYTTTANQQYRVDLMKTTAAVDSVAAGDVLSNLFITNPGNPLAISPTFEVFDLSSFAGQTVRLRFAEVDNQFYFNASVDAVCLSNSVPCPTTFTVNSNGDASDSNPGNGVCATAGGVCTLRAAIEEANALSSCGMININFSGVSSPITLGTALPAINHNININGPGANLLTVQRSTAVGTADFRLFSINGGLTITISGLTMSNGRVSGAFPENSGGAIWNSHSQLLVKDCTISGNSANATSPAGFGGGIFNDGTNVNSATLTIINSTITGNSAVGSGGGIFNDGIHGSATLTVTNSTISNNSAGSGGGVLNTGQSGNGLLHLSNSTISGNNAQIGGGIANDGTQGGNAPLTILNSTISGNGATVVGGGVSTQGTTNSSGAPVIIINATITNNRSDPNDNFLGLLRGGGMFLFTGPVTLRNTLLARNFHGSGSLADDVYNYVFEPGSSFNLIGIGGSGGLTNGVNNNQVGVTNPRLGPLNNNGGTTQTHVLLPGSLAIDAGGNVTTLNGAIDNSTTTVTVTDGTSIPAGVGFAIQIESEQMIVTAKSSNTLTVTRGANNTTATSHANAAAVNPAFDQRGPGLPRKVGSAVDIGAVEVKYAISATAGTSQSTPINTTFGTQLQATVTESGNPVSGVTVTFTAPASGASGTFPGNLTTATATTNASGVATAPALTANGTAGGSYNVVGSLGAGQPTANFSLTNTKGSQTITFGPLANKTLGDPDFTVSASASSGLPVSFSAIGQCTVTSPSPGTVHLTGSGSCTITASQSGNANYFAAPSVSESFTICASVVTNSNDSGAGSLRQAILDACDGSTITFDMTPGHVTNPITLTSGELFINKNLTIQGPGANLLTVMRSTAGGTPNFRIFKINSNRTVTISGLTITNGRANDGLPAPVFGNPGDGGGGILNSGGFLTILDTTITSNRTGDGAAPSSLSQVGVGFGGPGGVGGGIYSSAGTLTMMNVTVNNNTTGVGASTYYGGGGGPGGGVYVASGIVTLTNCTITGNTTGSGAIGTSNGASSGSGGYGGGIFVSGGTVTIKNTVVNGNTTGGTQVAGPNNSGSGGGGGGIGIDTGTLLPVTVSIFNSIISANRTGDGFGFSGSGGIGGGIFNGPSSTLTIVGSTISGNNTGGITSSFGGSGGSGGGILNGGSLEMINSTISGNSAVNDASFGGGIWTGSESMVLRNCTVVLNSAWMGGAQITAVGSSAVAILGNTIVARNGLNGPDVSSGFGSPHFTSHGFNLIGNGDGVSDFNQPGDQGGSTASALNPKLGPLANNGGPTQTHLLLPGSPAINAGNPAFVPPPSTDQRGFPRVVGGRIDIGAVEVNYAINATAGTPQSAAINTAFATQLQATVTESGIPMSGVTVTFSAPSSGPSGTFPGNTTTANALTNGSGVAGAPTFSANGVAGGPYNVTASLAGNLASANFALTNGKTNQTITFNPLPNKTVGDPDFMVSASASSGLSVSLSASGQCTVTSPSPGTVHITGAGSCTITASQAGNASFNPALSVQQSFNIGKANQTINFGPLANKTFGDPDFMVTATASSGLPVTLIASGQCTVNSPSPGTVHLTDAGTCTITASQAGNANYSAAANVSQSFKIFKATPAGCPTIISTSYAIITFPCVTQAGNTTFNAIDPSSAGTVPNGYTLCPTCPAYDITTTAVYTSPITACLAVPAGVSQSDYSLLKLMHGESGNLVDRSTASYADGNGQRWVCGVVASLSPFLLAQAPSPTPTPTPTPKQCAVGSKAGPDALIISRFRENGPRGSRDEFVEIFNPGDSTFTVSENCRGYGVFSSAGNGTDADLVNLVGVIPEGTQISPGGYFLFTGLDYSLGNLGRNGGDAGATAAGNASIGCDGNCAADIPNDAGLVLLNTDSADVIVTPTGFSNNGRNVVVIDRVGFAPYGPGAPNPMRPSLADNFCEGTCLQPVGDASLSGTCVNPSGLFPVVSAFQTCYGQSGQYELLRRQTTFDPARGAIHRDTNNNADDFIFISPNPRANTGMRVTGVAGVTAVLGAAGPYDSSAPPDIPSMAFARAPFDGTNQLDPRNAVRTFLPDPTVANADNDPAGTLTLRFRFTNNGPNNITGLRFEINNLSTLCGGQKADAESSVVGTGNARNLSSPSNCQGSDSYAAILKVLNSASETVVDSSGTPRTVFGTVLEDLTNGPTRGPLSPIGGGVDSTLIVNPSFDAATTGDGVNGGGGEFATPVGATEATRVIRIKVKFGVVKGGHFALLIIPMARTAPTP